MGIMQALLTSNSARIGGFSYTSEDDQIAPTNAFASFNIGSDGACSASGNHNAGNPPPNWYFPGSTGIGSLYWVRATVTSGSTSGGSSTGVWISCNSSPGWSRNATSVSVQTVNLTLDFASDSGGTNIVGTATVRIQAIKDT
jgi:hypothetical protein